LKQTKKKQKTTTNKKQTTTTKLSRKNYQLRPKLTIRHLQADPPRYVLILHKPDHSLRSIMNTL
jgi:hypothetical protein